VNSNSLGIHIQYGDIIFYLPGDIQSEDINQSLLTTVDHAKLKCHVIIAPSHGIHCTKEFAEVTHPMVSIASCLSALCTRIKKHAHTKSLVQRPMPQASTVEYRSSAMAKATV
jgi:hypothetical protein